MFEKVLIANRGAVACRIIRTLRNLGVLSVAVFSEADTGSLHVAQADQAVCIGPPAPAASYLNADAIIAAAHASGAQAVHPGYGFLSENADFAERCAAAGLVFIGPTAQNMRAFGLKHHARELARQQNVPLTPGSDVLPDLEAARRAARRIGWPIMLKATAGGGGIGMRVCAGPGALDEAFTLVSRLAESHFGQGGVYLERYVPEARHIEVQIFGDGAGHVIALGERDCSLQRRNQKVFEETPAPGLAQKVRERMLQAAVRLTAATRYRSAGTVEFLLDHTRDEFYFLEVNARLQVEHGVTEQVTGIDLVEWMVRGAAGDYAFMDPYRSLASDSGKCPASLGPSGCSIQARLYAEDPGENSRPCSGTVTALTLPPGSRVETWITTGTEVSTHYDPLLAKLIVTAPDRARAVEALRSALDNTRIDGIETNLDWLRQIARSESFGRGEMSVATLSRLPYQSRAVRILSSGVATSVQDYPGRRGFWHVGVPPSGPMDSLAFRLGNRLLGNPGEAAGLEITAFGPSLRFEHPARLVLTGASCDAWLDTQPISPYRVFDVAAGQILKVGRVRGPGLRSYLMVAGGIDAPPYLGSRATFALGNFGGHGGRNLTAGDVLHLSHRHLAELQDPLHDELSFQLRPSLTHDWQLRVLCGPHAAPDYFTTEGIEGLLAATWHVHYNSSRTGVRLTGPRPLWARRDGGEAGLHPSNIHDNAYAVGAIDFTGDMPIILGPDGPSLGGFVCPFVVIAADLWKIGQLAPGDRVRFESVSEITARAAEQDQDSLLTQWRDPRPRRRAHQESAASAMLAAADARGDRPRILYRRQGDHHLLVEYGEMVLDLTLRLRVHALMLEVERLHLPGIIDITPGIRSLQIHYEPRVLSCERLLRALTDTEDRLGELERFEVPSRIVWLPLSFADPAVNETIARYMTSVRADAPWCPDNIEFIRRINGLESVDDVRRIVFDASYLVMGLGDVYLGAPVAVPLDPRHRLVTTKYNPARTWTPPNVVGIGGAYMCIYGMEGPGGYQLFGRTVQVWNSHRQTRAFRDDKPWLLRFFDQIRFFPVSAGELREWRREFPYDRRALRIETDSFRLCDYRRFLQQHQAGIEQFTARRQSAFAAEREAWAQQDATAVEQKAAMPLLGAGIEIPEGAELIEAPLGGQLWRLHVRPGDRIEKGAVIAAIEAMKTECTVPSPMGGTVRTVYVTERQHITPGTPLIALEPDRGNTHAGASHA